MWHECCGALLTPILCGIRNACFVYVLKLNEISRLSIPTHILFSCVAQSDVFCFIWILFIYSSYVYWYSFFLDKRVKHHIIICVHDLKDIIIICPYYYSLFQCIVHVVVFWIDFLALISFYQYYYYLTTNIFCLTKVIIMGVLQLHPFVVGGWGVHVCMCVCIYIYIYIYIYKIYIYTLMHICVCVHACILVCSHVCMSAFACMLRAC